MHHVVAFLQSGGNGTDMHWTTCSQCITEYICSTMPSRTHNYSLQAFSSDAGCVWRSVHTAGWKELQMHTLTINHNTITTITIPVH